MKEKDHAFNMRLNPTTYRRVKAMAAVSGCSMRELLERAARKYYEELPSKRRVVVDGMLELEEEPEVEEEEGDG